MEDIGSRAELSADVAILGGGASGALLAIHLLRAASSPLRIVLLERKEKLGRGWAYGTRWLVHRLNVPAVRMGALLEKPDDFCEWLVVRGVEQAVRPGDFVPRRLFGQYLEDRLNDAERAASQRGVLLSRVREEAVDLVPLVSGNLVRLQNGETISARYVVLATGLLPPAPLPGCEACPASLYLGNPWLAWDEYKEIARRERVLAVGTGLTFLDAINVLAFLGFKGMVYGVSPRRLLPEPYIYKEEMPPRAQTISSFASVRALTRQFREAVSAGTEAQDSVQAFRPLVPGVWQRLSLEEKARFMRHVRPFWNSLRHRCPPEDLALLKNWMANGKCQLVAARLRGIKPCRDRVEALLELPGGKKKSLLVDTVINCTGPRFVWKDAGQPFWDVLFQRGLVKPGPLGLGIATGPLGEVIGRDGVRNASVFALGPLRIGDLWETIAIPEIRAQAAALAGQLCESLHT